MITIAIDYDGTFSLAPGLWARFIADANSCGCRVFVISCRKCECSPAMKCENHVDLKAAMPLIGEDGVTSLTFYLTNGAPKRWFMEQRGIKVDIWVDDEPMTIEYGR